MLLTKPVCAAVSFVIVYLCMIVCVLQHHCYFWSVCSGVYFAVMMFESSLLFRIVVIVIILNYHDAPSVIKPNTHYAVTQIKSVCVFPRDFLYIHTHNYWSLHDERVNITSSARSQRELRSIEFSFVFLQWHLRIVLGWGGWVGCVWGQNRGDGSLEK